MWEVYDLSFLNGDVCRWWTSLARSAHALANVLPLSDAYVAQLTCTPSGLCMHVLSNVACHCPSLLADVN